jgi:hypothetical protein
MTRFLDSHVSGDSKSPVDPRIGIFRHEIEC